MGKRTFDILFSIGAILFFLPISLLIVLLILLSSPGPIFHTCQRVGRHGRPIRCWKFRTMCRHAEEKLQVLLSTSPALQEEWYIFYKLQQDPRVTTIGKFLRKTSLDELPQFFHVLSGKLSVVGPRPVTEEEISTYYQGEAEVILSIKPGLTGLWQTAQDRNRLTLLQRKSVEMAYVEQQSWTLDLKIIAKTIKQMFFPA